MDTTYWIIIFFLFAIIGHSDSARGRNTSSLQLVPDEQRLLSHIFKSYDKSVRPVFNASSSVEVAFGLTLIQIMDMEEKNQVLITNVWLEHEWIDERIRWDPKDYNNLHTMRVPAVKLWLPDIVLYNNADDFTTGYMPSNAMVRHDGTIFWPPPARLRSSCKIDITYFPFDQQTCKLKFGSWTYDQAQVDMKKKSDELDLSNYITNGEWSLVKATSVRNEVVYPISSAVYPDVTIYIVINRRILYYILNIILPCIWLNMLSLLAFSLPPDAGEKITLGITVLLSYSVFMLLVAESMPPTSEFIPLIGIYLTISMALTSVSVVLTVCVLKLHHGDPQQKRVPRWIRKYILSNLACSSCIFCKTDKHKKHKTKTSDVFPMENQDMCLRLVDDAANATRRSPIMELRSSFRSNAYPDLANSLPPHMKSRTENRNGRSPKHTSNNSPTRHESSHGDTIASERLVILQKILHYLKLMLAKRDRDDAEADVMNEWRQVAHILDRFLFWLFLITTLTTTFLLMVFIPLLQKRVE